MATAFPGESSLPPEPRVPGSPRILVVGCGGIGGILAAHLLEQGHDVTALTTNPLIADAINMHGFRVRGEGSPGTVRGRAVRELPAGAAPFDYVLLATQPPQVEEAARRALPALSPRGAMVCFQNGLCEERIAAIAGPDRVLGAIVAWGASMVEPGLYDRTSAGGFVLGALGPAAGDARIEALGRILEAIGPTAVTDNLAGARWSKLAINCAISSLGTIGGERVGVLMRQRFVRRLGLEIMTEAVLVARALGIRLEKVSGTLDLDWIALTDAERVSAGSPALVAKHALLLAVGARYRRLRSSMLAAIERGRPPAVEFLNGELVTRGLAVGIATPVNAAIREEVLAVARGARPSIDRVRDFFERTRPLVAPGYQPPASAPFQPEPPAELRPAIDATAKTVASPVWTDPVPAQSAEAPSVAATSVEAPSAEAPPAEGPPASPPRSDP